MNFLIYIVLTFSPTLAIASHLHKEYEYQSVWCERAGGVTEYRLEDGERVDCLTEEYAVEFDFAPKWAEGIGQALYYAKMTGRKPGVVLILEKSGDDRYLKRITTVADGHGLKVWTITPSILSAKPSAKF